MSQTTNYQPVLFKLPHQPFYNPLCYFLFDLVSAEKMAKEKKLITTNYFIGKSINIMNRSVHHKAQVQLTFKPILDMEMPTKLLFGSQAPIVNISYSSGNDLYCHP